ncbi:MAG: AAA family ATPase, partial [Vulcanimicrobiaceae bacterium]
MTPTAIIDDAINRGIAVISITDHNTIASLQEAIEYAANFSDRLLFVPGIELSCNEGHLLVYFDASEYTSIERFFHSLQIVHDNHGSHVASSMVEVIRIASKHGGICVAAHIDTKTGFEIRVPGYPSSKKDLLLEPGLRGLEFRNAANAIWYSSDDPSTDSSANERRQLVRERLSKLGSGSALARLHNSDAHELAQLTGGRALTRIKVSTLSFDSFRAAFADPEARIRIDELVPPNVPYIIGLSIGGGFLDDTSVHFASNLNVFFGGRGTGKSTAIQSIAFALGRDNSETINQRFQAVSVYCEDANGTQYRFDRTAGGDVFGRIRKAGAVTPIAPESFPIEYYGQGELGEVAEASLTDPSALQTFLDRHIDFEGLLEAQSELEESGREIALQLAPAMATQAKRPELSKQLEELEARLRASEDSKIKGVAAFQNRLTAERTLKSSYEELSSQYRRGITLRNLVREPKEL